MAIRPYGKSLGTESVSGLNIAYNRLSIAVEPLNIVIAIGNYIIEFQPRLGNLLLGSETIRGCRGVVIDGCTVVGSVGDVVVLLRQLVEQAERHVAAISPLVGHQQVDTRERTFKTRLGREHLIGFEVGLGAYIKPSRTGRYQRTSQKEGAHAAHLI